MEADLDDQGWEDASDASSGGWGHAGPGLDQPGLQRGVSEMSCASGWGSFGGDDEGAQGDPQMTIPVESENRLLLDIAELNCTSRFQGVDRLDGGTRVRARLGLKLDCLSISREQRLALGLNNSRYMVLEAEFGAHYLWEGERPKITVGHADSLDVESPNLDKFLLSWTIEDRIKSVWLNRDELWPPTAQTVQEDPLFPAIRDTMEMTGQGYLLTRAALDLFKTKDAACLQLCSDEGINAAKKHLADKTAARGRGGRAMDQAGASTPVKGLSGLARSVFHRIHRLKRRMGAFSARSLDSSPKSPSPGEVPTAASEAPTVASSPPEAGEMVNESDIMDLSSRFSVPDSVAALALETSGTAANAAQLLATREERDRLTALNEEEATEYDRLHGDEDVELELASHNVLVRLMRFATLVLANAVKSCMICDDPLDFVGVKPAVCLKPSCIFSYEEFGLGFDLAWEILHQPELVDMVISFAVSACDSLRVDMCFPSGVRAGDPTKPSEPLSLSFNLEDGTPDRLRLKKCLDLCPSLEELKEFAGQPGGRSALKFELDKLDPLLYPLLRWLLTSNRAHLRLLEPSERIKEVDTPWQFVFVTSAPEREAEFQRLRKQAAVRRAGALKKSAHGKDGAIQTWHGSPLGNWHSIMRTGLRNLSGTKHQLHGAAHGAGIYMAVDMQTSVGYCRKQPTQGWSKSLFGQSIYCLALCEVVDHENLKEPKPFFVVPQEEWVMTRFFFVMDVGARQRTVKAADIKVPDVYASRKS